MADNLLLFANHTTSVFLSVACWFLAHSYAAAGYPYGRAIAILWAALGMSVLITAFSRVMAVDPSWMIVCTKFILFILAVAIAYRVQITSRKMKEPPDLTGGMAVKSRN